MLFVKPRYRQGSDSIRAYNLRLIKSIRTWPGPLVPYGDCSLTAAIIAVACLSCFYTTSLCRTTPPLLPVKTSSLYWWLAWPGWVGKYMPKTCPQAFCQLAQQPEQPEQPERQQASPLQQHCPHNPHSAWSRRPSCRSGQTWVR